MLSQLQRTITERGLLAAGDRVLVAVSGGPDSLALLHGLRRLAPRLGVELCAASVDHGLRPEAAAETEQVAAWSAGLGVACQRLRVQVTVTPGSHVSLQEAARRARLAALAAAAERAGCTRIALGHTADDQAETILFRIVRGTGLRGLGGIPYRRGPWVRPLLDVRRADLVRYLRRRGLTPLEDASNRDPRFTRSRVRHAWLPFLGRENPRVVEALLRLGAEARRLEGSPAVPPAVAEPPPRQPARLARAAPRPPVPAVVPVPGTGRHPWPAAGAAVALELRLVTGASPPRDGATFDPAILDGALEGASAGGLVIRSWQPGDRLRPRGGRGTRKLQDMFVDARIPREARARLPVLATAGGTVLFVPGLRPAEQGRPARVAGRWLEVRLMVGAEAVAGQGADVVAELDTHLSRRKADSAAARVDDLSVDDNTFPLGAGCGPRTP